MGSKHYHELHSRLYDDVSWFLSGRNAVTMACQNGRRRSVANAESRSTTLTRYGRHQHSVSLLQLHTTIASVLSVHDLLPRLIPLLSIGSYHDGKVSVSVVLET